jgi:capsule polysaccharide export protein KpsE/RkpR
METTDAIYPTLYPDLMEDNGFVTGLFNIKVVSQDGEINTTYHDYLKKHQKRSIWSYPGKWIKSLFKTKEKTAKGGEGKFDPYYLSESENNIAEAIRANIIFSFNEKTGVISIKAKAQDPLICKTLADSVTFHLQDFITQYRTNKARVDYDYYKHIAAKAKSDYEKVRQSYASMSDASTHISLRSAEMKLEDMENDMQLKFNTYTSLNTQLEAAKAKVQEKTPAFTIIEQPIMPYKAASMPRAVTVLIFIFLGIVCDALWILYGRDWNRKRKKKNNNE